MPLLDQLSPKDSPKKVLEKIDKILGPPDGGMGGGPIENFRTERLYMLNDGTGINVNFVNDNLVAVTFCTVPDWKVLKVLYHVAKTGTNSN